MYFSDSNHTHQLPEDFEKKTDSEEEKQSIGVGTLWRETNTFPFVFVVFAGVLFQKRITGNKNYINFVFVFLSRRILAPLNKSHFLLWYIGCSFCAKKKKIKKASGII